MRWKRVAAIVLRQAYLMRGSPARVLPVFAWVAVDIVLWGFITRYLNAVTSAKVDFVPSLLGAVLFWDFFQRVMQGVTTTFFEDVWSRNFLNVFASPLRIPEYVAGLVLSSIATSAFALVVMVLLATAAFGLAFFSLGLLLVPFLLVLFLFGVALGIVGASIVLRLGPAAEWFIWPIPALLSPFAGVFYPVSTLPWPMQLVSRVLPPSYVFEALRRVAAGGGFSWRALAAGGALALVDVVLAGFVFARVHRYVVRTGLLARYSAETVT
jgi:ABC-2 type transport system permease protein